MRTQSRQGGRQTPETEQSGNANRPTADQACRECRRRKSRCDRIIPMCHLCGKFSRQCTYEKLARTPLTRTYLTKVESELARTKALLQRFIPGGSQDRLEENDTFIDENRNEDSMDESQDFFHTGSENHLHLPVDPRTVAQPNVQNSPTRHRRTGILRDPSASAHQVDPGQAPIPAPGMQRPPITMNTGVSALSDPARVEHSSHRVMRPESEPQSIGTAAYSLETPPSSNNFEWDERAGAVPGGKFVDGMASLTSRSHEGGYLGSASGAALLRLTDDARSVDGFGTYGVERQMDDRNHSSTPFALNSMSQLEPFVDAYFNLYHCSYPIVHEATFRAQFMEIIPRPPGNSWHVLLFVISALGVFTSSTQPTDADFALFDAAKARLSIDVLETGNLVLVQALTLISNYLQKRNKPNSGYNYMGLARRVAMGIGLHKEFPTWDASLLTLEMRRRVWYCLYIFDIGAIITFSRPLDFPEEGVDVNLPTNAHDSDITAGTKRPPLPAQETTIYTHLQAQATFHFATNHIYSKIISVPLPSAADLIGLDDQFIGKWLAELPPYFSEDAIQSPKFTLCHAILRWRYRNFRILMYRPFLVGRLMARGERCLQSGSDGSDAQVGLAIERCLNAAREAVDLISLFWRQEQRTMMACWYGLYFLFQAILIPVICLRNDPQSPLAEGWRGQVLQAVEILESMALLNSTAQRCLGVVQSLCGAYLQPNVEGWGRPTEESPQTQLANLYPLMWPTLEMGQLEGADSIIQESTIMDFMNRLPVLE